MTARSGDALSHVCFQARQRADLSEISAPEFCETKSPTAQQDLAPANKKSFPSYLHGGHETALRNETDKPASFAHYLPKSFRIER